MSKTIPTKLLPTGRNRAWQALTTVAAGVAMGIIAKISAASTQAEHVFHLPPSDGHLHIASLNSSTDPELICLEDPGPSIDFSTTRDRIINVLDSRGNPDQNLRRPDLDWEGVGGSRFAALYSACYIPYPNEPYPDPNVKVIVADQVCESTKHPTGTPGCLSNWYDWRADPRSGHLEFFKMTVKLDADDLETSFRTPLVNHEFGHVLGLCDGGTDPEELADDEACNWSPWHLQCRDSVMHSYGNCDQLTWPSAADRTVVQALTPGGSGGGIGGCQGKAFCTFW